VESEPHPPSLLNQVKALAATGISAFQNRTELFILELEEERSRLLELVVWALAAGFLAMMFLALLTFTVVWLFPDNLKPWALGGFCLLYLTGGILAFLNLKAVLSAGPPPFEDSINEIKKDREWLDSLK
jgi:uncharacterized membrane protein YqjE